jgi:repressor LexA
MAARSKDKQDNILKFIRGFTDDHDYGPTIREIVDGCDLSSTSVANYNLNGLEKAGFIRRNKEVARGIELLEPGGRRPRVVQVPVYGTIAAGAPIEVPGDAQPEEYIEVGPEHLRGRENVFALRVKGDSMVDDGIFDGDTVILQAAQTADDGDTVAAWLPGLEATTLKRFYREGERVRLQPRNTRLSPIYVDAGDVQVQAKLIASISPA